MMQRTGLIGGMAAALLLFIGSPRTGQAQQVLLPDTAHTMVKQGLDYVYNLEYAKGDELFTKLKQMYPEHPAGEFLMALNDWWRIKPNIADQNAVARYSKSFHEHLDRTIEMSEALLEEDEFDIVGLFFKGAAYGYRARLKATTNPNTNSLTDWYGIFRDANEGRKSLLTAQRIVPGNSDILLGSGLFNYYVDYMPQKYPILKSVSLPPGDRTIGLKMLRISAERALYSSVEADYALIEILTNFEKDNRAALAISDRLHTKYPNNPDFHKYLARNLFYTRNYDRAYTEWGNLMRKVKGGQGGFELSLVRQGLYYMGYIKLKKGDAKKAVEILSEGAKVNRRLDEESSGYYAGTLLLLGNAYDVLGQRKKAIDMYEEVLDNGYGGEDDRYFDKAREYMKTPYKN